MDAYISPITSDYVMQDGTALRDIANGLANAVYIRLMTPLGSYWRDANLGSRLHELQREKDLKRVGKLAKQYAETALQPLIDDGRAIAIEVTIEQPHNSRMHLLIAVTNAAFEVLRFQHPVKINA